MTQAAGWRLAPSSRIALYVAAVVVVYLIRGPRATIITALALLLLALIALRIGHGRVSRGRWRGGAVFIGWVFVMRLALDVVGDGSLDRRALLVAGAQASRVAVLLVGALILSAITPARELVDELETSRLPRAARLLVMMLVQYPRVLRDRYDQIVEAQIARGADRPRSVLQRVGHGSRVLLPVLQSELNAIGERAGLVHLRGLDVDIAMPADVARRTSVDLMALLIAATAIIVAIGGRLLLK